MTLHKLVLKSQRGGSQDNVQWTMGIDGPADVGAILGALIDGFQTDWTTLVDQANFSNDFAWYALESYPGAGGPADAVTAVDPVYVWGSAATYAPEELAVRVSSMVMTPRGRAPAGGLYFGPFSGTPAPFRRPPSTLLADLLAVSEAWHGRLDAEGCTPVVISRFLNGAKRPAPVGLPIISYSVDDAWDVQRRRGADPSTRTYGDPI